MSTATALLPYQDDRVCPKCKNVDRRGQDGRFYAALDLSYCRPTAYNCLTPDLADEHIHYRCNRCHYRFTTECADISPGATP